MSLACMPTMIDSEIVLKNVDYEPENASFVTKPTIHPDAVNELRDETERAAKKLKEDFFKEKAVEIKL